MLLCVLLAKAGLWLLLIATDHTPLRDPSASCCVPACPILRMVTSHPRAHIGFHSSLDHQMLHRPLHAVLQPGAPHVRWIVVIWGDADAKTRAALAARSGEAPPPEVCPLSFHSHFV